MKYFTFFFYCTKSLKSSMCFIMTEHLNLDTNFSAVKVKCSPTKAIKLCLIETHFVLFQFKIFNLN